MNNNEKFVIENYKSKKYIIVNQQRLEEIMKETEMKFVEINTIPQRSTKKSSQWLELFEKIPVGKAWVVNPKEYNIQTIRAIRAELEKKKLLKFDIVITQRTENNELKVFVCNNGKKQ